MFLFLIFWYWRIYLIFHSHTLPILSGACNTVLPLSHTSIFLSILSDKGTVPSSILKTTPKCLYIFGRLFSMREAAATTAFTILEPTIKNSQGKSNFTCLGFFFLGKRSSSVSYYNFDLVSKLNILSMIFHIVFQTAVHISYVPSSLTVLLY